MMLRSGKNTGEQEDQDPTDDEKPSTSRAAVEGAAAATTAIPRRNVIRPPPPPRPLMDKDNLEELEWATIEKCRKLYRGTDLPMVIFRINVWPKENIGKKPKMMKLEDHILLNKYEGVMHFHLDVRKREKRYVLDKLNNPVVNILGIKPPMWYKYRSDDEEESEKFPTPPGPFDEEYVWLEDSSEDGIYFNGIRYQSGRMRRLLHGDLVGVGASHDSPVFWEEEGEEDKRGFVFKVINLAEVDQVVQDPEWIRTSSPEYWVLNDPKVLGKIFGYLNYNELKTARLVDPVWKETVNPKLFSRTLVKFKGEGGRPSYASNSKDKNPTWEGKYLFNWNMIHKYEVPNCEIDCISLKMQKDYYNTVISFLKDAGHFIKHLRLTIRYDTDEEGGELIRILSTMENLESIRLRIATSVCYSIPHGRGTFLEVPLFLIFHASPDKFESRVQPMFPIVRNPNVREVVAREETESEPEAESEVEQKEETEQQRPTPAPRPRPRRSKNKDTSPSPRK